MIYFIFLLTSIVYSQHTIETKEFKIFKNVAQNQIDFSKYLDNLNNTYKLEIVNIQNIEYSIERKNLLEFCDFQIELYFPLPKQENQKEVLFKTKGKKAKEIIVKRCNNKLFIDNDLLINNNNYILNINENKHTNLSCEITFWISGVFNNYNDKTSIKDNGILREWYNDESLYIEYNYKDGKKNGIQKRWHLNGQQDILYYYKNGMLDGVQKSWYDNGQIKAHWNYTNDKQNGINKEWYTNGQLKYIKLFNNGILIELKESYDKFGNIN